MQAVGHAVKTWCVVVQWCRTGNPVKERDPIVYGQMKLPNTRLQAIDLHPSCSKQTQSNMFDTDHGVPFLKIAHTMYIHNLIKNLFDFALVRLK